MNVLLIIVTASSRAFARTRPSGRTRAATSAWALVSKNTSPVPRSSAATIRRRDGERARVGDRQQPEGSDDPQALDPEHRQPAVVAIGEAAGEEPEDQHRAAFRDGDQGQLARPRAQLHREDGDQQPDDAVGEVRRTRGRPQSPEGTRQPAGDLVHRGIVGPRGVAKRPGRRSRSVAAARPASASGRLGRDPRVRRRACRRARTNNATKPAPTTPPAIPAAARATGSGPVPPVDEARRCDRRGKSPPLRRHPTTITPDIPRCSAHAYG